MLAKVFTATLIGLDCKIVEVEVDYRKGQSYFSVVGLADKSIQEARDRIPAAIKNSGMEFIPMRIVMNLAPAELNKTGPSFDLSLAVGYLLASDQLNFSTEKKIFIGELALDGRLRPVSGILPIVDSVKKLGFEKIFVPIENAKEAGLVPDIKIYPIENLKQLIDHLNGTKLLEPYKLRKSHDQKTNTTSFDLSQVKGQFAAKRALEIAASGGHNILMSGVPGSGKTMLSRCLPAILPRMEFEESLEVTRIYSVAGLTSAEKHLISERPFRTPHHTSSQVALVGGGNPITPGEISLSHRGVLFLDEFPEFSHYSLEALRQPLEDKVVTISRASGSLTFPANFILVAAMNPCKCGHRGDPVKECTCTNLEVLRYQKKLSGPILDRIDLLIHIEKVKNEHLFKDSEAESSTKVSERVQKCRDIQVKRFKGTGLFANADMGHKEIKKFIKLSDTSTKLLKLAVDKMNLSARSYFRLLKVSRTIADLEGSRDIKDEHISEALSYRVEI